ncbi:LAETG motif-containing sortase-dependent surface protein [Streptomyces sp. NPDC005805]|uniref:LAETG motif-containing sortase-dependent surface protein n=1 Tax=Streptomyces sp. NPDC005805 TaxID=3157068 RepID=UPI0033D1529F
MRNSNGTLRRSAALVAAAAAGVLGVGLAAGPAMAHNPNWSVTCDTVDINLTHYGKNTVNTVAVTVDGKDLLPTKEFEDNFATKLDLPDVDKEREVRIVIKAQDGEQYNRDETKTAPPCVKPTEPTPSPSESTTTPAPTPTESSPAPSEKPSETPSEKPSETPSSEAPAPTPTPSETSPGLAETGSSSSTPLIAGAAAVVLAAGGGIMWAARKRRGTQN